MNIEQTKRVNAVFSELFEDVKKTNITSFESGLIKETEWKALKAESMKIVYSYFNAIEANKRKPDSSALINGIREYIEIKLYMKSRENQTRRMINETHKCSDKDLL
jgi:hypothetical protein